MPAPREKGEPVTTQYRNDGGQEVGEYDRAGASPRRFSSGAAAVGATVVEV